MKLIHTSDWHIGQSLHNIDRSSDHAFMLLQIKNTVAEQQPDLLLISGDIFHTSQPSASAQKLLTDALVEIRQSAPDMTIVLTAGNHDSASRHETHQAVWELADIHTIGSIDAEHPENNVIEIPGKGWLAALPYVNERNMPEGYIQNVIDYINDRNSDTLPVVVCAHTTVRGSDFTGHEDISDYCVGGIDYRDLEEMGNGYDYLALGHIHHPQTLHGSNGRARYCGTPLSISFDERFPHSISLVKIAAHESTPEISEIILKELHPLVNIPSDNSASWEECLKMLEEFDSDTPAYIRLNTVVENALPPGAFAKASELLDGKAARLAYINTTRKPNDSTRTKPISIAEFKALQPMDIAERFCTETGLAFSEELKRLFMETAKAITDSED